VHYEPITLGPGGLKPVWGVLWGGPPREHANQPTDLNTTSSLLLLHWPAFTFNFINISVGAKYLINTITIQL